MSIQTTARFDMSESSDQRPRNVVEGRGMSGIDSAADADMSSAIRRRRINGTWFRPNHREPNALVLKLHTSVPKGRGQIARGFNPGKISLF